MSGLAFYLTFSTGFITGIAVGCIIKASSRRLLARIKPTPPNSP